MTARARVLSPVAALLAIALGAAGCGHTETHEALLRPPSPPSSGPVEVYMADQPLPSRPFLEMALVQSIGFGDDANPEAVVEALTDKAARLGCDAVLRTFVDQGYTRAHASGVCVKWLAPGPAAPPPVLPPHRDRESPGVRPTPAPRIEPLPSAGPSYGGGI